MDVISVLGCGNIGLAIAQGLVNSKLYPASNIILTKRNTQSLQTSVGKDGYQVSTNNLEAVSKSRIVIVCVTPAQLDSLLDSIAPVIDEHRHTVISVVSGASIDDIKGKLGAGVPVVRAMPNTAIKHCQSMTCLAVRGTSTPVGTPEQEARKDKAMAITERIFNVLGTCIVLKEEQIVPATALCACGIAFFCRAIRAAAQGGIEIGFHAEDAIKIAAQTAKGAATLLLEGGFHPEYEIDKVTTPQGCTIAGLNQMEHSGFSSAMIKGIVTSAEKAASLYTAKKQAQQQQHQHQPQYVSSPVVQPTTPISESSSTTTTSSSSSSKERKSRTKKALKEQSSSSYGHGKKSTYQPEPQKGYIPVDIVDGDNIQTQPPPPQIDEHQNHSNNTTSDQQSPEIMEPINTHRRRDPSKINGSSSTNGNGYNGSSSNYKGHRSHYSGHESSSPSSYGNDYQPQQHTDESPQYYNGSGSGSSERPHRERGGYKGKKFIPNYVYRGGHQSSSPSWRDQHHQSPTN